MDVLTLRWRGRFGHFLRAEANVNALSYPMPPRTAVLGLLGAILGLEKDSLELNGAHISISGAPPERFWHRVKLRKDPPAALSLKVRANQKGPKSPAPEKAALINQEWLFNPDFLVSCALPDQPELFAELAERVHDRRWHFSPCLGLSELLAEVELVSMEQGEPLPPGAYRIDGLCPAEQVELRAGDGLGVHLLRMPRNVDAERVFLHAPVYLEHRGRPIPVRTDRAWRIGDRTLCFL